MPFENPEMIIPSILYVFAFITALSLVHYAWRIRSAGDWPEVRGRVLRSDIATHSSVDKHRNETLTYIPEITYEYTVDGRKYVGKRISFNKFSNQRFAKMRNIADSYPKGAIIPVYYHPNRPHKAVLNRDLHTTVIIQRVCMALVLAALGYGIMVGYFEQF